MREWNKIRAGLRATETEGVLDATVAVGKVEAAELPKDIADAVIRLLEHPDPQVRAEAVRAIGVHWRLQRAAKAIAEILSRDEDSSVQLYAIGALGALGLEHADVRSCAGKTLAHVVLNGRFGDYERIVAYLELLRLEGRIDFEEYIRRDRDIPESLASFEIDRPWVEELMQRDSSPETR